MSSSAPPYQFALNATGGKNNLIVLLPDRLILGTVPVPRLPDLDKYMAAQEPLETVLPAATRTIPLRSLTQVEINLGSCDCRLRVRESLAEEHLSLNLGDQAHARSICDALQERFADQWDTRMRAESRLKATVTWLGLAALMLGAAIFLYIALETGRIVRAPWVLAFLVNTFGSASLLVLGGLLAALFVLAWLAAILKPGEIVTMTRPGD